MKINKNELHSMINQIDDDLLREAQEGYGREKSHMMQRIIPVAACILIMISGIVGAALKNRQILHHGRAVQHPSRKP